MKSSIHEVPLVAPCVGIHLEFFTKMYMEKKSCLLSVSVDPQFGGYISTAFSISWFPSEGC